MGNSFRRSPRGTLILFMLAVVTAGGIVYLRTRPISRSIPSAPSARPHKPRPDDDDDREPHEDNPGAALAFRRLQLQDENGYIPPDGVVRAKEHVKLMRRVNPAAARALSSPRAEITPSSWTWLGPGNIGGRVRSILVNPTTPTTWLAGSVSGGIWQTTNSGGAWAPLDDFMADLAVSTMVMQPNTPSTIYAGTGEGFFSPQFEFTTEIQGEGIFKSTDSGATWNQLASTNNATFYYVNRLAMSPDSTTLLAATQYGVSRSIDGGATFNSTTGIGQYITDLAFNPSNSSLAVASGYGGGAWYSTNGGASWTAATGLPSAGGAFEQRVEIAYAASNPTTVYASVDYNGGAVYISSDGGATYSALTSSPPSYLDGQGWYDNAIWVDPVNASTVVVGGIDLWRTTNAGISWSQISNWQASPNSAHADHHAIVSVPGYNDTTNTTVIFGDDGGIYSTADVLTVGSNGNHTTGWVFQNHNLGITQFYGAAGNQTTGVIVGGSQDNHTLVYTPGAGANQGPQGYQTVFGGDGGYVAADAVGNYFYGEYTNLQIFRNASGTANNAVYIDGIEGNTCLPVPYSIPDVCTPGSNEVLGIANFIAPLVLDPNNPQTLLAGGVSLWRTTNARAAVSGSPPSGPSWASIKGPDSSSTPISAIAVASGNSDLCWVGHNDGNVFTTTNCTAASPAWTQVNTNGLPGRYVTRITIDATNNNRVYVCLGGFTSNNIWVTINGGSTWTPIAGNGSTGLPKVPVRDLAIDPGDPVVLYAGTEVGIFTSLDGGNTWDVPAGGQDGPANVSVDQLFWMGSSLVAATWGRGLFEASAIESGFTISVAQASQTVPPGSPANYTVNTAALGASAQNVALSASGLPAGATYGFNPSSVTAGNSSTLTVNTASSTPVGTVTLTVTGTGVVPVHTATTSLTVSGPALKISKSHTGNFTQLQTGATYTVTVSNGAAAGPTSGPVTVTDTLPAGLTATAIGGAGTGWTCTLATLTCSRSDVLNGGASYPAIPVTVSVGSNAGSSVTNQASVSYGGSVVASASDPTTIITICDFQQSGSVSVADVQLIVNQAMGVKPPANDLSGNGVVNIVDVQIEINAALNRGCAAQ